MTRWSQDLSMSSLSSETRLFAFGSGSRGLGHYRLALEFLVDQTDARHVLSQASLIRLACFAAIQRLPDAGLLELVEVIRGMIDFYSGDDHPSGLIQEPPRRVVGKRGPTIERPTFYAESE